jgi:DNA excision repair protein ERCC-6
VRGSYANAPAGAVETAFHCAVTLKDTITPHMLRRSKAEVQAQISLPGREEQV